MTRYIWDVVSDNVLMEKDEAGATTAVYTQEPGQFGELISQRRNGQTSYYHYDGQGSTRALTDENGNVTDTYTYSAFGEEVEKTGTTVNPYRYIGSRGYQYNEETNDYYIRERIYEPAVARWLSVDPIGFASSRTNLYAYVRNAPVSFVDPSGLAGCSIKSFKIDDPGKCSYNFRGGTVNWGYPFEVNAEFNKPDSGPCECCEYRQYISCTGRQRFGMGGKWGGWLAETGEGFEGGELIEDCRQGLCYGHRDSPGTTIDRYRKFGCVYRAIDTPGFKNWGAIFRTLKDNRTARVEIEFACRFVLNIIDTCCDSNNVVVDSKILDFHCRTIIDLKSINDYLKKIMQEPIPPN